MVNSNNYLRQVGISEDKLSVLHTKLTEEIAQDLNNNPIKKRGVQSKAMTTESNLLLTLTYLRHYPTFANLGNMFGISESYANKIYHKTVNHMINFIHPKKITELSSDVVNTVVVDVAEQEIERPVKKQKQYYSGKKKDIL